MLQNSSQKRHCERSEAIPRRDCFVVRQHLWKLWRTPRKDETRFLRWVLEEAIEGVVVDEIEKLVGSRDEQRHPIRQEEVTEEQ